MVGSDAGDDQGKGVSRKAFYIFDVKSEMELEKHQITFLSCQDLLNYYEDQTGKSGKDLNVYELVQFFIEKNPNGYYFLDEVPLIKGTRLLSLNNALYPFVQHNISECNQITKLFLFLSDGREYNRNSIEKVQNFIQHCKRSLVNNPFLWIAFQSNCLNDRCSSSKDFKTEFEKMIQSLRKELNFYSPHLNLNMRNSSEVGELAKTLKTESTISKITNVIESLPPAKSSITSPRPTLIPILIENLDENYSKLFERATENGKNKCHSV